MGKTDEEIAREEFLFGLGVEGGACVKAAAGDEQVNDLCSHVCCQASCKVSFRKYGVMVNQEINRKHTTVGLCRVERHKLVKLVPVIQVESRCAEASKQRREYRSLEQEGWRGGEGLNGREDVTARRRPA